MGVTMRRRSWIVTIPLCSALICACFCLEPASASEKESSKKSKWKGSELLPPLATNPQDRDAALRRVLELNAERIAVPPGTAIDVPKRNGTVEPSRAFVGHSPNRVTMTRDLRKNVTTVPGTLISFDAIGDTGEDPADPDIAAGPNHIVIATDQTFAVYDKCGNWRDGGDIETYFSFPGSIDFLNPRVIYDAWSNRWLMAYIGDTFAGFAKVYLFVSNSSNPEAGWYYYQLDFDSFGEFPRDVQIAVDPLAVYITSNQYLFSNSGFKWPAIWLASKADMYSHSALSTTYYDALGDAGEPAPAFGIRPAQMRSYDGNMYFINSFPFGETKHTVRKLSDPLGTPVLSALLLNVSGYTAPPNAQQQNLTYLETGDARFVDVVYYWGTMSAVSMRLRNGEAATYVESIDPATPSHNGAVWMLSTVTAAIDVDEAGTATAARLTSSTGSFPSTGYTILDIFPTNVVENGTIGFGQTNFTGGGAGTDPDPYQLANYLGVALDPTDNRTMWIHGVRATNSPFGGWQSVVGAVSSFGSADLDVTVDPWTVAGPPGGPFNDDTFTFTLSNSGNTTANWTVSNLPAELNAGATAGYLTPGGFQDVIFSLNSNAYALAPGSHMLDVGFDNCTGVGDTTLTVTIAVAEPVDCTGLSASLRPYDMPDGEVGAYSTAGAFITAITDVDLCAIAFDHDFGSVGWPITVNVYEANTFVRGSLVATGTTVAADTGMIQHAVPLTGQLSACQDYEIQVDIPAGLGVWNYWNDSGITPYDKDGVVRVRSGAVSGSPGSQIIGLTVHGDWTPGSPGGAPFDLAKPGGAVPPPLVTGPGSLEQGAFVVAAQSEQVYGIGVMADIPFGETINANIYSTNAAGRDALLAQGSTTSAAGGLRWHDVPIAFTTDSAVEYDVEVTCTNVDTVFYWDDTSGLPYTAYGKYTVNDAESGGNQADTKLVRLRIHACDEVLTAVAESPRHTPMYLLPPRPNPASGRVDLSYSLSEPAVASIAVYDVRGRRVADVFASRKVGAGTGIARFDAQRLPSGIYFVKLETATASVTRKLVVTR